MTVRVGVVGYCPPTKFDEGEARRMITEAFDKIAQENSGDITVVAGLTNVGVLKIAYEEATKRNWRTIGVACEKANDFPLFPVDETVIIGKNWGDESQYFLSVIDVIVRIGGGKQSVCETDQAKREGKSVIEYDLLPLEN